MNPVVFIIPLVLVVSGMVCFFILPMPLWTRVLVLVCDLIAAGIVGLILWRRSR
jgi:hypothetical protein